MNRPKAGNLANVYARHGLARLALLARLDCIHGSCRALPLAQKADRMGWSGEAVACVTTIYCESSWRWPKAGPWECSECGATHQGVEAAMKCCDWLEDHE